MKNITLIADARLIERARLRAREQNSTLNEEFRRWLEGYAGRAEWASGFDRLMRQLRHVDAGRTYRRDEMHERR